MAAGKVIRIGMVNFINTAPLYEVWKKRSAENPHPAWWVFEGPPAQLNRMLEDGELDLGFISSHEYAQHPQSYRILSNLSISADGEVGSVFLFSELPIGELDGKLVELSPLSQTSNSLIKIILEDYYHVRPEYCLFVPERTARGRAVLAIGDQALRLRDEGRYPVVIDLSQIWQRHTGLPFVFAVWAVRADCCPARPAEVRAIHNELLSCVRVGRPQLAAISAQVAPRIPMTYIACHDYLKQIEYDLGPAKIKGLEIFYQHLLKRQEASAAALPLKICD